MSPKTKAKKKQFITLNLKLALVVVIALIMTFLVFEVMEWGKNVVANRFYLSDAAMEENVDEAYDDLTSYISVRKLKSTDTERLQDWLREHSYTYIMVSDNYSIYFDGGWRITQGPAEEEDLTPDQADIDFNENKERISFDTFEQDVKNRIIDFDDGPYYVYINVYKEQNFYRLMTIAEVVVGLLTLVGIVIAYNGIVLGRVARLNAEVQEVAGGNLMAGIESTANDEIGQLADNVDAMRDYIIRRLQSEKEAWDKNSELITAMSHDIRTPLTSLIGYLDIIESGKYETEEEEKRYIATCRDKALQLKDLSDKLFQYFLVFGSQGTDKNLEVYDAAILLQQIISEHSAELINYGFNIDFQFTIEEGTEVQVEMSSLRRLFDNLFSNIIKYADKSSPLRVSVNHDEAEKVIVVRMLNAVLTESRKVESNKIGLKTCDKICSNMGGTFFYEDEGQVFTVRLTIPVYHEAREEAQVPEGLEGIDIHNMDIQPIVEARDDAETQTSDVTETKEDSETLNSIEE